MTGIQIAHGGGINKDGSWSYNDITTDKLQNTIDSGFKFIEIDIQYVNNNLEISHDQGIIGKMSLQDLIDISLSNNVTFILDIKGTKNDFRVLLDIINNSTKNINGFDKFVIQIYNYDDIEFLYSSTSFRNIIIANWKCNPTFSEIHKIVEYCREKKIEIIGTSLWSHFSGGYINNHHMYYSLYEKLQIPIFIHGEAVNDENIVKYYINNKFGVYSKCKFIK